MSTIDEAPLAGASRRELPPALRPLWELALDLRWTWSHGADELWEAIDGAIWAATGNAWYLLQSVGTERLERLARDPGFLAAIDRMVQDRRAAVESEAWLTREVPALANVRVAYFSMEFGLGEALPLYAGGLGVLAGDFLKGASDLGLPVVGVGILFAEGYFRQTIDAAGRQEEWYPFNDPTLLPITPALAADGSWLRVLIEVAGRPLWLRAWKATVGRVSLYLLDTNDPRNGPADRAVTAKLYGGGSETRLLQELVLGVGGWRLLSALGLEPTLAHLNEGHAAFAVLERARSFAARRGVSFQEALWATRAGNLFTTHTPVAAGFDRFDPALVERVALAPGCSLHGLGVPAREVLGLGRIRRDDDQEPFQPAILAVRGCATACAVSRLHGEVARRLFSPLFPGWPAAGVPITHVTNGVHVPSWDSPASDALWTAACGKDRWRGDPARLGPAIASVSDEALWRMRGEQRAALVHYARGRLADQLRRRGAADADERARSVLDPSALTLGFARRFTAYKRPELLLRDRGRLIRLLTGPSPVQLLLAGKAHPTDQDGKRSIAAWIELAARPELRGRLLFLEDYDLALAEQLVRGVDVWINTPRRGQEACGTSGMKVLVNGGLNLSARDGWWDEAATDEVGWSWGDGSSTDDEDADHLLSLLEHEVVPAFHDRDERGLPVRWLGRVRASMSRLTPTYSVNRMLGEHVHRLYLPALALHGPRSGEGGEAGRLAAWEEALARAWPSVRVGTVEIVAGPTGPLARVAVELAGLATDAIAVELDADGDEAGAARPMRATGVAGAALVFEVEVPSGRPASALAARVVPRHALARLPAELPLIARPR